MEVLGVDESGGHVSDIGDDEEDDGKIEGGGERARVKKAESKRRISSINGRVGRNL